MALRFTPDKKVAIAGTNERELTRRHGENVSNLVTVTAALLISLRPAYTVSRPLVLTSIGWKLER